jgi:hypothetical protein
VGGEQDLVELDHFDLPALWGTLLLMIDETLERRRGKQIKYKGWFRDPILSTREACGQGVGHSLGLSGGVGTVPWSQRPWALPFMTVLALGEKTSTKLNKRHRTIVQWAEFMIDKVRRWQPNGRSRWLAMAVMPPLRWCNVVSGSRNRSSWSLVCAWMPVCSIFRLHSPRVNVDQTEERRTPDPTLATLGRSANQLEEAQGHSLWQGTLYRIHQRYISLAYTRPRPSRDPLGVGTLSRRQLRTRRFLLLRCKHFCQANHCLVRLALEYRSHLRRIACLLFLGFETQRQWSDRAIERTTPCLFGIFSLVTIMTKMLYPTELPVRQTSWYIKEDATFSDALAAVRKHLWSHLNYERSPQNPDLFLIPQAALFSLVDSACYST